MRSYLEFLEVPGGEGGVSGILDVNNATITVDDRVDDTESFFFAEVMKYLYVFVCPDCARAHNTSDNLVLRRFLTLDDPSNISLDEFVFNTEAHPFKAPPLTGTFGSPPSQTVPYNAEPQQHVSLPQISGISVPKVLNINAIIDV